jgi:hypothetical protein
LWTICPCWPQIMILLISASQVARISNSSMSYWHLASLHFYYCCCIGSISPQIIED